MDPRMIDMVGEFLVSRGIRELLASSAVTCAIMAYWIVTHNTDGVPARESTRHMAPTALLSMVPLIWIALRNFLPQQESWNYRQVDAFTDISLVAPAFGIALTVLLICFVIRLLCGQRPSSETEGRWGNAIAYILIMGGAYYFSIIIIVTAVLPHTIMT